MRQRHGSGGRAACLAVLPNQHTNQNWGSLQLARGTHPKATRASRQKQKNEGTLGTLGLGLSSSCKMQQKLLFSTYFFLSKFLPLSRISRACWPVCQSEDRLAWNFSRPSPLCCHLLCDFSQNVCPNSTEFQPFLCHFRLKRDRDRSVRGAWQLEGSTFAVRLGLLNGDLREAFGCLTVPFRAPLFFFCLSVRFSCLLCPLRARPKNRPQESLRKSEKVKPPARPLASRRRSDFNG